MVPSSQLPGLCPHHLLRRSSLASLGTWATVTVLPPDQAFSLVSHLPMLPLSLWILLLKGGNGQTQAVINKPVLKDRLNQTALGSAETQQKNQFLLSAQTRLQPSRAICSVAVLHSDALNSKVEGWERRY